MKKYIIVFSIVTSLVVAESCEDQLDVLPQGAERVAGVEQQGRALMPGGGTGGGIRFLLPGLGFRTLLFLARQHGIYGLERRRGDGA